MYITGTPRRGIGIWKCNNDNLSEQNGVSKCWPITAGEFLISGKLARFDDVKM